MILRHFIFLLIALLISTMIFNHISPLLSFVFVVFFAVITYNSIKQELK